MDMGRNHWRGARGTLLDRPPHLAPRSDEAVGYASLSRHIGLESLYRTGRDASLSSLLYAVELARMVRLRHRRTGRYGLPYHGSRGVGVGHKVSHQRDCQFKPEQPVFAPSCRNHNLYVPSPSQEGQGEDARGEGLLVRRWTDASPSRRTEGWRNDGRRERRNYLCRFKGKNHDRLLRHEPHLAAPGQHEGVQAAQACPSPRKGRQRRHLEHRCTRTGLDSCLQGIARESCGIIQQLRTLRPLHRDGGHGYHSRPSGRTLWPSPSAQLGWREHVLHQYLYQ